MVAALIPPEQWKPTVPVVVGVPGNRSPELLVLVAAQFKLESSPRYQPVRDPDTGAIRATWCNVALTDMTTALGAPIPHTVDPAGEPVPLGSPGARELTANDTVGWLETCGPAHGWTECDEPTARAAASAGRPAAAVWRNPNPKRSGHVALVLPDLDPVSPCQIAQAGASCFCGGSLARGFGMLQPRFFTHP